MAEEITDRILRDRNEQVHCECGNVTIYAYAWSNDDGEYSCPKCMVAYLTQQIKAMRAVVYELSPKSPEVTAAYINAAHARELGVTTEDLKTANLDFS